MYFGKVFTYILYPILYGFARALYKNSQFSPKYHACSLQDAFFMLQYGYLIRRRERREYRHQTATIEKGQ